MNKNMLKNLIVGGVLLTWGWFVFTKIPIYQKETRLLAAKEVSRYAEIQQRDFITYEDSEGKLHHIPKEEYKAEQEEWAEKEKEQLSANSISMVRTIVENTDEIAVSPRSIIPKKKVKKNKHKINKQDLDLLSRLVESESGIESYECKEMVASVVMNRVNSKLFPNTIKEVIFQKNGNIPQFSVTITLKTGKRPIDCTPSKDSIKAAKKVLKNGSSIPENVIYFYGSYLKKTWLRTRKTYMTIDHTVFAYQ